MSIKDFLKRLRATYNAIAVSRPSAVHERGTFLFFHGTSAINGHTLQARAQIIFTGNSLINGDDGSVDILENYLVSAFKLNADYKIEFGGVEAIIHEDPTFFLYRMNFTANIDLIELMPEGEQ